MREGSLGAGAGRHRGYEAFLLQYCIGSQGKKKEKKRHVSPLAELPKVNNYSR